MKNTIILNQDDAYFTIENPETEAEKKALEIIESYNSKVDEVKKQAQKLFPVKFSPSILGLTGNVEQNKKYKEENLKGFSYKREENIEYWITPSATLIATFIKTVGEYKNKFEFEII